MFCYWIDDYDDSGMREEVFLHAQLRRSKYASSELSVDFFYTVHKRQLFLALQSTKKNQKDKRTNILAYLVHIEYLLIAAHDHSSPFHRSLLSVTTLGMLMVILI